MSDLGPILSLLAPAEGGPRLLYGVAPALVTNSKDPDGLGRVKVRFPWLSERNESTWARVLTPMSGKGWGLFLPPEVGDEVLVAFEHGRAEIAYVLGSLWNGKKKPPPPANKDGKANVHTLKSKSGLEVTLDDGKRQVRIADKSGKERVVVDAKGKKITIQSTGDVVVEAKGKLTLKGQKGVVIQSGTGAVAAKAGRNLELKAGALVNVKGRMINLN